MAAKQSRSRSSASPIPKGKKRVVTDIDEKLMRRVKIRSAELGIYKNTFFEEALERYLIETEDKVIRD